MPRAPPPQERVSFANYWRDPMRLDTYRSNSAFLADLNNEARSNTPTDTLTTDPAPTRAPQQ